MKLNNLEFVLVNNALRAASQQWIETLGLISMRGSLSGKHVLEAGCGRGVGVEILFSLGADHVTGIDLDPKMVAFAEKRLTKYGKRVRVFVGDAESIQMADASFDAVVDYGVIHYIPQWHKALKGTVHVLQPDGVFYFENLLKGPISTCQRHFCSLIHRLPSSMTDSFVQNSKVRGPTWRSGINSVSG